MTFRSEYRVIQDEIAGVRQPLLDRLLEALWAFCAWVIGR